MPTVSRSPFCSNCRAPLTGPFCAQCGQEDINYNVSLRHLVPEVLHEYLGFDSAVFASIPALLFKPGFLTNQFNAGRRAEYISPLRLYLIVSAVFFFLEFNHGSSPVKDSPVQTTAVSSDSNSTHGRLSIGASDNGRLKLSYSTTASDSGDTNRFSYRLFRTFLRKALDAQNNQVSFRQAFADALPPAMLLLLPVVALLLKVMYVRRRRLYVEHLVFSFHLHAFVCMVLITCLGLNMVFPNDKESVVLFGMVVVGVYLFLAVKRVYSHRWYGALTAMIAMVLAYLCIFVVFYFGTLVVAVWIA